MNRTLLVTLCAICTSFFMQAQFGIRTGVSINDFNYEEDPGFSSSSLSSPFVGLFVETAISTVTGIRTELNYTTQGTKADILGTEAEFNLRYLELPVLFQYRTKPGFNFHLGPSIGYAIAADVKTDQQKEDIKDLMNEFNLEGNLGINYAAPFGLELEIRYHLGLMNISKEDTNEIKTQGIIFGIGYRIN